MSAINSFRRCPKSFDLGYERGLQPRKTNEAVEQGASFHKIIEHLTKAGRIPEDAGPMADVVLAYVAHKPLPAEIVTAETPTYTDIFGDRTVYLRTTFDLVYTHERVIIGRDYKTFGVAPTLDLELDFQGRVYTAALKRQYGGDVRFEYEYVRRELFHNKKGAPDPTNPWSVEESYLNFPLSTTAHEDAQTWGELQETVYDIVRKQDRALITPYAWTRTDLKGNVNSCKGCFYSELCKTEYAHGELTPSIIDLLAEPERRKPDTLPEAVAV
jgi:hypothetical protein